MNKQQIQLQLFMREMHQETLHHLDSIDLSLLATDTFRGWQNNKRDILTMDVADTHWIKTCTGGYITEVIFHKNGTLTEYRLFDRFQTKGVWSILDGILKVSINKADNVYSFNVVGNKLINIHSAIEYKNAQLHSYLKFAQIK